jgi:hypothetical protein
MRFGKRGVEIMMIGQRLRLDAWYVRRKVISITGVFSAYLFVPFTLLILFTQADAGATALRVVRRVRANQRARL